MWIALITLFITGSLFAGEPSAVNPWILFEQDGKWGYKNKHDKVVIDPVYDWAEPFVGRSRARVMQDGKYGVLLYGSLVPAPCEFDSMLGYGDAGLIDGEWRVFDWGKKQAINLTFNAVKPGGSDHTAVSRDSLWGFVANNGRDGHEWWTYIPPLFDEVGEFVYMYAAPSQRTLAPVKQFGLWGYIRTDGTYQTHPQFEQAENYTYIGHAAVRKDGKWGVIDNKGDYIVEPLWDAVALNMHRWDVKLIRVKEDGKWGCVDESGLLAIPCSFDSLRSFFKDRYNTKLCIAAAMKDNKWGIINDDGSWRIEALYDSIQTAEFRDGAARLWNGGDLFHVDTTGRVLLGK